MRTLVLSLLVSSALGAPADRLPDPKPERCLEFHAEVAEGEIASNAGLSYEQVRPALAAVIQTALYCPKPDGMTAVHLTFELTVGCDGVVSAIEASDDGHAPASYVQCVADVVKKADFPAHDMPDGFPVTYPVDVAW